MNDADVLLTVAIVTAVFIGLVQLWLYYDRKKQRLVYPVLWKEFETCKKFNSYTDLLSVGNKLVFNKHISRAHLDIIHSTAVELEARFPEFESLRLNAYNKQLHYGRT
ncbi:MAG: hypothetical protein AB8B56_19525, partial [Crocinitomicaceae bacterium]